MYNIGDRVVFHKDVVLDYGKDGSEVVTRKGDVYTIESIEGVEIWFKGAEFYICDYIADEYFKLFPEDLEQRAHDSLIKQDREDHLDSVIATFSDRQLYMMVEEQIELIDMDRWKIVEKMVKTSVSWVEAKKIIDVLYEMDIEVLELGND